MHPVIRNILAVIAGAVIGSVVNGSLIMMSGSIIPPPNGADVTTEEGLKATIHLFEPKHFIMPFLAHALGTLCGAMAAAAIAVNNKMRMAMVVGVLFLIGGVANVLILSAPMWFNILDLTGAYFPMAYLGGKWMTKK
ncbi:MAG TPA: hypothetical protein VK202_02495 [Bacteroidia bacterium]|nr:hypothetical protein [Bacteroidia bacterium]